jgi:hypothetical protein
MEFAICRSADGSPVPSLNALDRHGLRWIECGTECLLFPADPGVRVDWNRVETPSTAETLNVRAAAIRPGADGLHVVTQKGGAFQQAHPDVAVLLDKGRHLVVSLDAGQAGKIASRAGRYSIRPVLGNETIVTHASRRSTSDAVDERIRPIVASISHEAWASTLAELASFPTRHSLRSEFRLAAERLADRLRRMGYEVSRQRVAIPGGETLNIIADKYGSGSEERSQTLVTAHLDSINHPGNEDQPVDPSARAPGADDNASGCAGVIEIARILKDTRAQHDLRLVLFGGEEQGMLGSVHFVNALPARERARIKSVVNMDMIAVVNTTRAPTVLLEGGDPISRSMIDALTKAAHVHTDLAIDISMKPELSDHVSFINAGMPAVLTIEGNDRGNHNIHSARDTLETIDHDLALAILRMNTAFVARRIGA